MTYDTVFPQDAYCIVDQQPIEANLDSLYCSSQCRLRDNEGALNLPRTGKLVTYKTNVKQTDTLIEGSLTVTSKCLDSESIDEEYDESSSDDESGEEDVFQIDGISTECYSGNVRSSSLPSLVSDSGAEEEYSFEDEIDVRGNLHYEWLYEAPAGKTELRYEVGGHVNLDGRRNSAARNYELWRADSGTNSEQSYRS
ncbi:DEKNAAC101638 [Brettanomyces naardenensis]|uniref:DEKNAAC101638 n=1 Tax=Brettanomyces naardenensis TaxID=13370 RepID=A0A448YIT4_BRENA|nr:DEKNAAC101638 [Brettanomyces naardenensis]